MEITKSQEQVDRMTKIKDNLEKVANIVVDKIKDFLLTLEKRNEERVYFDHYRTKLNKMDKERGSADIDEQEKYARNQSKFDSTKLKFEELTRSVNDKLEKVETKIEKVTVDLTLKFSKEVQLAFYRDMNQTFFRLKNIEAEMIEVAHQEFM